MLSLRVQSTTSWSSGSSPTNTMGCVMVRSSPARSRTQWAISGVFIVSLVVGASSVSASRASASQVSASQVSASEVRSARAGTVPRPLIASESTRVRASAAATRVDSVTLARLYAGQSAARAESRPFAPGRVLVRLAVSASDSDAEQLATAAGAASWRRLSPLGLFAFSSAVTTHGDRRSTLELHQRLLALVPDAPSGLDYPGLGGGTPGPTPNDTYYPSQWHLDAGDPAGISAPGAWAVSTGSNQIVVAILDSGVVSGHPDLTGRRFVNEFDPIDGIDNDGNGFVDDASGWDFVDGDTEPEDANGHGTWVLGALGANAGNQFAVAGVDANSRLLVLRVLGNDNTGTTADLIAALDYVLMRPEIRIVNLSLIDYPADDPMLSASLDAVSRQAIVIACAGNNGLGTADTQYPGAHPGTISVGASTPLGDVALFSSTGTTVDLIAPGESVVTVDPSATEADTYGTASGCSMAVPLVSGVAGLIVDVRPQSDGQDLKFLLRATADDLGEPGWDEESGAGRLNAESAVIAAQSLIFQGGFETGDTLRWQE